MMPKPFWREMATTDFGADAEDWIVVLPLAATEQHGPHLPVGVDTFIAEGLVNACVAQLPETSLVTFLPVQEVGKSNEHIRFPGTVTLDWETAIHNWIAIGRSVARAGPKTLVMITSHGGNVAPMDIVARELREREGMRVVSTSWGRLGDWQDIYNYEGPVTDVHGGLAETSLMLALRPDLVNMDKAADFVSDQSRLAGQTKLGWHGAAANMAWLAGDLNAAGAVGNAAAADADLGARDIASTVDGFATLIDELERESDAQGALL